MIPSPPTVIVQDADTFLLEEEVAVTVAVPSAIAVISPVTGFTSATAGLLLDHDTDLIVASAGSTEAVSVVLAPASNESSVLSRVIFVTLTGGSFSLPSCLVPS